MSSDPSSEDVWPPARYGPPMDVTREAVGWGLLFAVPPAIGAGAHVAMVRGSSWTVGGTFGLALGVGLFLLVVAIASTGENAESGAGESETP